MVVRHTIHRALYRPILFAGVPPRFFTLEVFVVLDLLLSGGFHVHTLALLLGVGTVSHSLLAWVCADDPLAPFLYLRSLRQADRYCALSTATSVPPPPEASVSTKG